MVLRPVLRPLKDVFQPLATAAPVVLRKSPLAGTPLVAALLPVVGDELDPEAPEVEEVVHEVQLVVLDHADVLETEVHAEALEEVAFVAAAEFGEKL